VHARRGPASPDAAGPRGELNGDLPRVCGCARGATEEPVTSTAEALREHCRAHLAGYKVPKQIDFLPELPRTGSGKISKQRLRDRPPSGAATNG